MPIVLDGTAGITTPDLTDTSLTSGRVVYAGASGNLTGSANLLYSGTDLTVYGLTVGRGAGAVATNTAVGVNALAANTTGIRNTAVGEGALDVNDTGIQNTAVGRNSLGANTSGQDNCGFGLNSLVANTTGSSNTAVGQNALAANITASGNTAVGYQAGFFVTGASNSVLGYQAGYAITTGTFNTAIGRESMGYNNVSGDNSTAVGANALNRLTTGPNNTAVGYSGLYSNTTGSSNVAIGVSALSSNTTASNNTAVGYQAGNLITTGADNTCIGLNAGDVITTGNRNVVLGRSADTSAAGGIDQIVIGYAAVGKGNDTFFNNASNSYNGGNTTTWATTSDQRLKKNIVDNTIGLEKITALRVRNFEYRIENEITELPTNTAIQKTGVQLGVIAQEIQQVLPDCVTEESTGVLSVQTDNLIWYLVNSIKQLKAEIDQLKGN